MSDAKKIVDLCEYLGEVFDGVYLSDTNSMSAEILIKHNHRIHKLRIQKPVNEEAVLQQAKTLMNVK